jgi:hypothetical protein
VAAPQQFQKAGLTFVWNSGVNGKLLDDLPPRTWLVMDMNGAAYVVPELVPRNGDGYLVLYADGSVKWEHQPPQVLAPDEAAKLKQMVRTSTRPPDGGEGGEPADGGEAAAPAAPAAPQVVVPADPDAAARAREAQARAANPDEDDAIDE